MRRSLGISGVELARVEPEIHSHIVKLPVMLDTGIRELLLARKHEIGHPDPSHPDPGLAVTFALDQLGSMMRTRFQEAKMPSRFGPRSDEEFVAEAIRSVCAYLQVDVPTEPALWS